MMQLFNFLLTSELQARVCVYRYNAISAHTENTDTDFYYQTGPRTYNSDLFLMKYNIKGFVFCDDEVGWRDDREDWGVLQNFGKVSYGGCYYRGYSRGFSKAVADTMKSFISGRIGKIPSVCSYGQGDDSGKANLKTSFLGGRNSQINYPNDGRTIYGLLDSIYYGIPQEGITHDGTISRKSSTRHQLTAGTSSSSQGTNYANADTYSQEQIALTLLNNGWLNNFNHWHWYYSGDAENYFSLVNTALGSNFVWRCGYDEALEYLWFRKMINDISVIDNGGSISLEITHTNNFTDIDTDLLQTPISIKIDISDSSIVGSDISCAESAGIRKVADNEFVLDVDYSASPIQLTINTTETPSYYDFTEPVISNIQESSGVVTFDTNIECKVVFYLGTRGGAEEDTRVLYRSTVLNTSHSIDFNDSGNRNYYQTTSLSDILNGDVYIGVISAMNQSILSGVQQFN